MDDRQKVALELGLDRVLAHQFLFSHRHPDKTPDMHREMILDWHSPHPQVSVEGFRGGAKSTIAEEALIIQALYKEFGNGLIVSATQELACERLTSIQHELETNERIEEIYGPQLGPVWGVGELVLANGVRILAKGRGQKMRGTKFHDRRPDAGFADDLEDTEDSAEIIKATKKWFMTVFMPAMDPHARLRVSNTPVAPDCLVEDLAADPTWESKRYPIKHLDAAGEWVATWPERFPMAWIDAKEQSFRLKGMLREFGMEYMCESSSERDITFNASKFRGTSRVRTWEASYSMFDPARTTRQTSAMTGYANWSWINSKLVVWKAWGQRLMPSEIVEAIFEDAREDPTWIGVEEDGLNEWLLQPIRQEQARRGMAIPIKAVRAPKGKISFIGGLQPYFNAGEVEFAGDFPELKAQLLNFPRPPIDVPNALAYALRMRPGAPIYDGFGARHVAENLSSAHGQPAWLALNATGHLVTGVLAQSVDGAVRVLADYVREGDAGEWVESIVGSAQADAGRGIRIVVGPEHFGQYATTGLVQAIKRLPAEVRRGVDVGTGRAHIRGLLQRDVRGQPAFTIGAEARGTLNAFAGGYARMIVKGGSLDDRAEEGMYKTLVEGLEAFAGLLKVGVQEDEDGRQFAYTHDGRRYVSMLANQRR